MHRQENQLLFALTRPPRQKILPLQKIPQLILLREILLKVHQSTIQRPQLCVPWSFRVGDRPITGNTGKFPLYMEQSAQLPVFGSITISGIKEQGMRTTFA